MLAHTFLGIMGDKAQARKTMMDVEIPVSSRLQRSYKQC